MERLHLRTFVVAVGLCLAVGVLGGVAAADHAGDSKIESNTSVAVNDDGGYFNTTCTGSPTEHECDKSGTLDAGPLGIDYEGFNDDSFRNRSSDFGDSFVFTVDGEEYTFSFRCHFTDSPPEDNPCPVDPPGEDGNQSSSDDGHQRSNSRSPDHANRP
jgi:hypothetical protein